MSDNRLFINHRCMAYWHFANNTADGLDPNKLTAKSGKKAWFTCPNPECEHVFQRKIGDMPTDPTKNICPFCVKSSSRLCENTDPAQGGCIRCYNRTFATCEKANEWSSRNEIPAHQVMRSGRGSFLFTCSQCKHDYSALLTHACVPGGAPCPYCAGRNVCDVTDCQTCEFARNKPARIKVDEQQAIQDANAGRRTCDMCGESKLLESFAKLNSGNRRATCTSCRNQTAKGRGSETVNKAKETKTIATKVCRECNCTKSMLEFGPGRQICQPCRSQKDVKNAHIKAIDEEDMQTIQGLPHRGELPGPCRDCQRPFSLDNASRFRYRNDICKYVNHCNECRSKQERSKNSVPMNKLNNIRYGAVARGIHFNKEDTDELLMKLEQPCHYCGMSVTTSCLSGLDRVDNTQGYNNENTVPCCPTCNLMKGTMTLDEFKTQIMYCMAHMNPDMVDQTLMDQLPKRVAGSTNLSSLRRKRENNTKHTPDENNKIPVIFYNLRTGRIAHTVSSVKEASDLVGIDPVYARTKIYRTNIPWILPHWGARPAMVSDGSPDPDENVAMFTALSQNGNRPIRYTRKFQVIDVRTQQVIVFRDLASIAKVVPDMNLENVTKQVAEGVERVQINDHYWVELVETEEIPNAKQQTMKAI